MKKKLWIASLSATALASLLLVNGNQVKAATDSGDAHPTEHEQATDPIQTAQADVNSAQAAVHTAQGEVTNKENALRQAKTDHEGAITAYNDQAKNVQDAQKVVNQKQTALEEAQRAAQAATPERIVQVQHNLDEANRQKTTDEATVISKQTGHEQKQTAYNNAKTEAETAAQTAESKKTALDNAKTTKENAQTALDQAQAALNNAAHENHSEFTINSDFANAIHQAQEYLSHDPNATSVPENISFAIKAAGASLIKNNRYQSDSADKNVTIDMNHITDEQMNNIRVFYLNLLNGIRSQLGYRPLKYNESAMKLSDKVVEKYEADHWDPVAQGHDVPALEAGYSEVGMPDTYEEAMGFLQKGWVPNYETTVQNDYSQITLKQSADPSVVTMDDVKNNLYGVVSNMLFNDETSNWGHTFTLTHPDSAYMGFSISKHHDERRGDYSAFHMNPVNPRYISQPAKFDQNANLPLTDTSSSSSELQANVDTAQHALDNATSALTDAQTAYDTANSNKTTKEQAAETAKTAMETAASALAAAQAAVRADQTNIDNLTSQLQALQNPAQAVHDAQAALDSAQTELTNAQNALTALQPARDAAQAQIDAAQTALDTAITNLQTAQNRLSAARTRLHNLQHPTVTVDPDHGGAVVEPQIPVVPTTPTVSANTPITPVASEMNSQSAPAVSQVTAVDLTVTLNEGSIPVYDQAGQVVDHITGNVTVQLTSQMARDNQVFYQIEDSNKWVKASDLSLKPQVADNKETKKTKVSKKAKKAKKTATSYKYRRVARVVKRVRLVDNKGRKTKRTLEVGTNWNTFAKRKINGKWYYRLGTQKQWARATAMKVRKHSKF